MLHILLLLCFTYLCLVSLFLVTQIGSGLRKKKKKTGNVSPQKNCILCLTELYPNNQTLIMLLLSIISFSQTASFPPSAQCQVNSEQSAHDIITSNVSWMEIQGC